MPTNRKKGQAVKHAQEQEIEVLMHSATDVMTQYRKQITIGAAIAAVVLIIWGVYSFIRMQNEQKAGPLLAVAYDQYSPAAGGSPNYAKALELFRGVQKKYPGTMSGAVAQYYIGNSLADLGQADEALKEYQNFVANYASHKFLLGMVHQRMGYVYRSLGRRDEAIKEFEQAETLTGAGVATVELAKLYESAGNAVESQKKYKKIQEQLSGTAWGIEAMGKVQSIAPTGQPPVRKEGK